MEMYYLKKNALIKTLPVRSRELQQPPHPISIYINQVKNHMLNTNFSPYYPSFQELKKTVFSIIAYQRGWKCIILKNVLIKTLPVRS